MPLEFKRIGPGMQRPLAIFFDGLRRSGDEHWFHPHPLIFDQAGKICRFKGKDLYYVAMDRGRVTAYGMLRGWDEGWKIPSLGIAVSSPMKGTGLARAFMMFLHASARARGAKKVRLKVFPENKPAVGLYMSLGYRFRKLEEDGQLVGFIDLRLKKKA